MKKIVSLLLVFMLLMSMTTSALANRMMTEGRKILFGEIEVLNAEGTDIYRGARDDKNDLVYIHADDLAVILGGEVVRDGTGENCILNYSAGNWRVELRTEAGAGVVTYHLRSAYEDGDVDIPYGRYELTDCLYVKAEDVFYLPFEEMLYMFAASWSCEKGVVRVVRPETFLDALCGFDAL